MTPLRTRARLPSPGPPPRLPRPGAHVARALLAVVWTAACTPTVDPGDGRVRELPERPSPALPLPAQPAYGAVASTDASLLRLSIEYPDAGAEVVAPDGRGFVTGMAYRARGMLGDFDVYLVLDVSRSTARPSGADIDGDGIVGEGAPLRRVPVIGGFFADTSSDPGDNVLACEVQAAKTLLAQLDAESTRVGLIAFSGDGDPRTPDAEIVAPLSRDYADLARKLDALQARGPRGDTNLVAAVQLATLELERDFLAARERVVERVVLLISDGQSTLPYNLVPVTRARAAVDAARDAAELSTRIFTYAVGLETPLYLNTLEEIADVTSGVYERVAQPADLIASFQALDLAKIDVVRVRNLTTGDTARSLLVDPYGTFSAIVELAEGANTLEVFARSSTGDERRERVSIVYRRDASAEALPVRALERRGRLLEQRLLELYARQIDDARRDPQSDRGIDVEVPE